MDGGASWSVPCLCTRRSLDYRRACFVVARCGHGGAVDGLFVVQVGPARLFGLEGRPPRPSSAFCLVCRRVVVEFVLGQCVAGGVVIVRGVCCVACIYQLGDYRECEAVCSYDPHPRQHTRTFTASRGDERRQR